MTHTNGGTARPRVLIEDWLPLAELGIESKRERKIFTDLPPLNYLHVWWARRPIAASQGVVLGGLLPAWSNELAAAFPEAAELRDEESYRQWFKRLVGLRGDPVRAAKLEMSGAAKGAEAFGYPQVWKVSPAAVDLALLHQVLTWQWGVVPLVADPTAGGGTIPWAAARYGLDAFANDLNSVAASVIWGGVGFPANTGLEAIPLFEQYSSTLAELVEQDLHDYYPRQPNEDIVAYLYAYEITCPHSGRPVPLLPNLWLLQKSTKVAIKVRVNPQQSGYSLEVVTGDDIDFNPAKGTMKGGKATSPYDGLAIDGAYIKQEAQAGRMRPILYAVATRTKSTGRRRGSLAIRAPRKEEIEALAAAEKHLRTSAGQWTVDGILPNEDIPDVSNYNRGHRLYGINSWLDMFHPRQALFHATFVRRYREIAEEVRRDQPAEVADTVLTLLTLMHGKMLDYNSRYSAWNIRQQSVQHAFESHNFSFKSTFAEKFTPQHLIEWAAAQVSKAYRISAEYLATGETVDGHVRRIEVRRGNASQLGGLADSSVEYVCIDPPYYDNVMYGELSDYFHVWHRRTLGSVRPDLFPGVLADVDDEAIANLARFENMGRRKQELADLDYESKMTGIFAECQRIMRDDGVLCVMFTHKRAEAWDTLGMGLLNAGFTVETSWPVNTEFEYSTHQANVNSAASTIMLVCRRRPEYQSGTKVFLDDIEAEVRQAARDATARFEKDGIDGVDLLLSTYGPVLSVISRHWPVYSTTAGEDGQSRLLRPDEALDLAREEVVRLQRKRIVGREVQVDDMTDFVMIAWQTYKAREFPYDEALKLGRAVGGLDVDKDLAWAKVLEKKSGTVCLLPPKERLRRGDSDLPGVRPDATRFDYMIDAVDTVLYVAQIDGPAAAKAFMDRLGLTSDSRFLATVQGLVNAIPRGKVKGEWVVPEAGLLDTLAVAYLPDIVIPEPDAVTVEVEQLLLDA